MQLDKGSRRRAIQARIQVLVAEVRQNWRFLFAAALAVAAIAAAVEISDRQGRFDLPSGYAVRMTCEPDPESQLWSGGCSRIAADIARTDQPSFLDLYRAFVSVHHRQIPSPATRRNFAAVACEPGFDLEKSLAGTRYVFIPLRVHFASACTHDQVRAIEEQLDERDRALLAIERAGLSQEALIAGALANLTEPLAIFAGALIIAALLLL